MGDVVNLGSRLEGLTKVYGVDIIVSEETSKLAQQFNYRILDKVRVKGKLEPITIYEPLGADSYSAEELNYYQRALDYYWLQRFSESKDIFVRLNSENSELLYQVYIKRCERFLLTPPDKKWDGVFTFTSK